MKLRKPPKLVYEISELMFDGKLSPRNANKYPILSRYWGTKVKELVSEFKIPEERWIFRDIKGPEFEKLNPFVSLSEARKFKDTREQEIRELVKVKGRTGEIINLIEQESSILHHLSRLKPILCRVYVVGIDDTKAQEIKGEIDAWLQS